MSQPDSGTVRVENLARWRELVHRSSAHVKMHLDGLAMNQRNLREIRRLIRKPHGMIPSSPNRPVLRISGDYLSADRGEPTCS